MESVKNSGMDWLAESNPDQNTNSEIKSKDQWNILIVDDEESIHQVTNIALKRFEFEGKSVNFVSAYSAAEAREILATEQEFALILLDVVMETENAGLDLARYIRTDLKNTYSRIILRTGQPGLAPEQSVIKDFDIDGYKCKSELQRGDLELVFYTSLRAYRDICQLQKHRENLADIIRAITQISEIGDLVKFVSAVLEEVKTTFNLSDAKLLIEAPVAFAVSDMDERLKVISASNNGVEILDRRHLKDVPEMERILFTEAIKRKTSFHFGGHYVYYHHSERGHDSIFAIEIDRELNATETHLIDLFLGNVILSFENLLLANSFAETQKLAISLMGGAMETRSKETGAHVLRVGEYSRTLAELVGQEKYYCDKISLAAQLHDVGKVGIPDKILNKPGKLDAEEWEIMKTHSYKGWEILSGTDNNIIEMAANIALDHHEKWDGSGYPNGKAGEEISLDGRIGAIADVFDALCSKRCYKEAWFIDDVRDEIQKCAGTQFDPELAKLFIDNFDRFKSIYRRHPDE